MIRLLRVVKLYKSAVKANEIKERLKREKLRNKKTKLSSEKIPTRANVTQTDHPEPEMIADGEDQ